MPSPQEQQWLAAWRVAGMELERLGREELASLSDEEGTRQATLLGVVQSPPSSQMSGLLHWQQLMKKQRADATNR